jgi:asparagine synthetase B (glutamine-hydrolysing)
MATENHWLRSNIKERLTDKSSEFIVNFDHIEYTSISFQEASERVVQKIVKKYDNIFIPLSGGMDSEYVFNSFLGNKFTPIIVDTPANKTESEYAFRRCRETNIKPVVIEKTEQEMVEIYYEQIFKKLNGIGYNSTATYIAGKYAEEQNGVVVIGEHGYDGMNEWDFYNDALIHEENSIYFFMYDIEIFAAMMKEFAQYDHHQEFKRRIYNIPIRPKIIYSYSNDYNNIIQQIIRLAINKRSLE